MPVVDKRKRLFWQDLEKEGRKILGRWVDERPLLGEKLTLFQENDAWFLETWYRDGCHSLDELTVTKVAQGMKLETKGENLFEEYFVLTTDNRLKCWNDNVCLYTARKL
ncbi:hypothetical protein [Shewanella surugensis]|uniref:Uncharacterized protein n=1 Tax=Shewanella surugensis TaxID=212020 RepID=A0ABT0LHL3_9GAMM|nr:hypothetical protein [Shewanella surugensis]MCL1127192.1 hypothetical protein [Shewanella surugensis]